MRITYPPVKRLILLLALALLMTCLPQAVAEGSFEAVVAVDGMNVYAQAKPHGVLTTLPRGTVVTVLRWSGKAALVSVNGITGVAKVAEMTRFWPIGKRPIDGGNADGLFCNISAAEYNEQANRNRFVIVQIEDPEAVDEIDGICQVPGIDMIFFGPGDYSHRLGISGQINHPEVNRIRELVAKKAHEHGIFAGTVAGVGNAREYLDMGYDFLNLGSDVGAMLSFMGNVNKFLESLE